MYTHCLEHRNTVNSKELHGVSWAIKSTISVHWAPRGCVVFKCSAHVEARFHFWWGSKGVVPCPHPDVLTHEGKPSCILLSVSMLTMDGERFARMKIGILQVVNN